MSKFITNFTNALDPLTSKLPTASRIVKATVTEDKKSIEIEWENDGLQTAYFYPVPFPEANLSSELPIGVKLKNPLRAPINTTGAEIPTQKDESLTLTVDKNPRKSRTGKA